jgi:flavin reductase (DIM6/NTAB) family NADH-FMN oxidoreductase RutF
MEYKRIAPMMTHLWSPMAAVTSCWEGKLNAQIVVAIGGASIVPSQPRVVVQIYKRNFSHGQIYRSGAFALNFLRKDQLQLIPEFGLVSGRDKDKLSGVAHHLGSSGSPVLRDCWGYLDCRVINALDAGDMTCFLGEVLEGGTASEDGPLWWRDAARRLPKEVMEEWDRKIKGEIEFSTSRMKRIDHSPWNPGTPPAQ